MQHALTYPMMQLPEWTPGPADVSQELDDTVAAEAALIERYGFGVIAIQREREPRQPVACSALWYPEGGQARVGIVCDVSKSGVFLQPVGALPKDLGVGSTMRVVFVMRQGDREHKVDGHGIVRWVGRSRRHKCKGYGIELRRAG